MAADHLQDHRDHAARTRAAARDDVGSALPGAADAVRQPQTRWTEELPELQLRVLSSLSEGGVQPVLHVLPPHKVEAEAQGLGRDVDQDGHCHVMGNQNAGACAAICSEARWT